MAPIQAAEFHCCYASNRQEALVKGRFIYEKFVKFIRHENIVDLGCGEGALLLWLKESGRSGLLGVESNDELASLAESFGVPVSRNDLLGFFHSNAPQPALYFYIDVIEHVPFEVNLEVLRRIPEGSRLILQTPFTESILGHQFFMNVPSHVAPYSPWVIRQMLGRLGYNLVSEGSTDGEHPRNWKNRLRSFFIRNVLGIAPEMILGGGNYYVVADRIRTGNGSNDRTNIIV
ncbi:MAG TPA: methyltransferase domain-containing protein [Candidatus Dormibacteraeota bacterium]|nr:methyltransferase domain-containing protein [Candidatus Dormibacteraeota bacterium]